MATRPAGEWLARFAAAGVPCQPVHFLSQVLADPHVAARGAIGEFEHPVAGSYRAVRAPWRLGAGDRGAIAPAPVLGAHTVEVLHESGISQEETGALLAAGVAWDAAGGISV
jgi:crotonobetainyl-CoA:carnitine CoA-transferase CaiB-like acyl-CoA transferase